MAGRFTFDNRAAETVRCGRILRNALYPVWVRVAAFFAILLPFAAYVAITGLACAWLADRLQLAFEWTLPVFFLGLFAGLRGLQPLSRRVNRWAARKAGGIGLREGEEITVTADNSGVVIATAKTETLLRWSGVDRLIDRKGFAMFAVGSMAYFIPMRAFADVAQRQAFVDWARQRLTPEARAKSSA